ncbi:MAG TPA: hypothetical protein VHO25_02240 [Polyangiaceae bacterium]|nr:hypothetical protein [Polyangiaceae bacterium]
MIHKRQHKSGLALAEEAPRRSNADRARLKWSVAVIAGVVAVGFVVQRAQKLDELARFERDGTPILEAAVSWREQHSKLGCPTISQLIQDDFLPKSAQEGGRRFRILCSADEVHVEQLGEDGHPIAEDALRMNQQVAPHEG